MADNAPQIPSDIEAKVGYALGGWAHVKQTTAHLMPADLWRANRVRRGALALLGARARARR